ncbi:PepSY domain-containing protein [Sphingosinithalassobacter sp. CS137]|uniref:PepSY domain-containing protein n=1 Tax=Sphingosinithalassobacter sp. CS137 TaxID=2762748 RepID=UPI00165E7C42|nr:PepSY domain-containing protein [Sphingosinithalassobacter sp. CS137]
MASIPASRKPSRKLRLHVFGSKLHKWLALFVGVQALLWMGTGAIMSFLKIEKVRSEHVITRQAETLDPAFPGPRWLGDRQNLVALTTKSVAGRSVVQIERSNGSKSLHDPATGQKLSPLSRVDARAIARRAWTGPETLIASEMLIETPVGTEFRGPFPAWQVTFGDEDTTRIYIDASSGAILAARSDTWRFFDFVWGLHIMDWTERDRINSWWLLVFGIGGTTIALSGFVLLANRFPKLRRKKVRRPSAGPSA